MKTFLKFVGVCLLAYVAICILLVLDFHGEALNAFASLFYVFGWSGAFGFSQIGSLVFGMAFTLI